MDVISVSHRSTTHTAWVYSCMDSPSSCCVSCLNYDVALNMRIGTWAFPCWDINTQSIHTLQQGSCPLYEKYPILEALIFIQSSVASMQYQGWLISTHGQTQFKASWTIMVLATLTQQSLSLYHVYDNHHYYNDQLFCAQLLLAIDLFTFHTPFWCHFGAPHIVNLFPSYVTKSSNSDPSL